MKITNWHRLVSLPEIGDSPENVCVVADDQGLVFDWNWHLFDTANELLYHCAGRFQRLGATINHDQLVPIESDNSASEKATIVRFIS